MMNRDPAEGLVCYTNEDVSDMVSENLVLETILCKIRMKDEQGKVVEKKVRAFLDTGSNMNIVRRSVAEGVQGKKSYFSPYITGGERIPPKQEKVILFQLVSLDGKYETPRFMATTSESPTTPFPPITFNPADYEHLKGVQFTEKYPREEFVSIDVLVGLQVWNTIDKHEVKMGKLREPIAKKTELGWVLSGLCAEQSLFTSSHAMVYHGMKGEVPQDKKEISERSVVSIKNSLEKLWKLDSIGIRDPVDSELTVEQERAKNLFYEKIEFRDGKYHVPI